MVTTGGEAAGCFFGGIAFKINRQSLPGLTVVNFSNCYTQVLVYA